MTNIVFTALVLVIGLACIGSTVYAVLYIDEITQVVHSCPPGHIVPPPAEEVITNRLYD